MYKDYKKALEKEEKLKDEFLILKTKALAEEDEKKRSAILEEVDALFDKFQEAQRYTNSLARAIVRYTFEQKGGLNNEMRKLQES